MRVFVDDVKVGTPVVQSGIFIFIFCHFFVHRIQKLKYIETFCIHRGWRDAVVVVVGGQTLSVPTDHNGTHPPLPSPLRKNKGRNARLIIFYTPLHMHEKRRTQEFLAHE